jgi:hypothetical protein
MKRLRVGIVLVLTPVLLALAVYWSPGRSGFATPAECLDAYREASRAGDVAAYRSCLGEPLRSENARRFADAGALAAFLRDDMKDVKSWVQLLDPGAEGTVARVDIEEVRSTGTRRLRFHLARSGAGWLIVGVEPAQEVPAIIPYGTHVSKVVEDPSRK